MADIGQRGGPAEGEFESKRAAVNQAISAMEHCAGVKRAFGLVERRVVREHRACGYRITVDGVAAGEVAHVGRPWETIVRSQATLGMLIGHLLRHSARIRG